MSGAEWQATSWAEQKALLEGMDEDENVPFRLDEEQVPGPTVRENVDAGVDVIDITRFRDELEADRRRKRGGDS